MRRAVLFLCLLVALQCVPAWAEPVTITFWHIWGGDRLPLVDYVIEEFERLHPDIKVEHQLLTAGERYQKILLGAASETTADVVMVGAESIELGRLGALIPLNEFIEREGLQLDEIFYPFIIPLIEDRGSIYYLPQLGGPQNNLLYYNKTMFEEAGLDSRRAPETWRELEDYARKLMRFDGDRITRMGVDVVGHPYVDGRAAQVLEWMVNNGALAWDGQEVLFNTPAGVDTLQWMLDFTNEINRTYSSINVFYSMVGGGNAEESFLTETAAMCLSGPWTYFQAQNRLVDTGIGLRPHNDQEFRAYAGASWGYGISTASKHKEAAWEFVKFMTMAQEGAGWFTLQQARPSAVMEFNRDPEYFNMNPYWPVIIQGFESAIPLPSAPSETNRVLFDMVTSVIQEGMDPQSAVTEAHRQLQRLFDEWN